MKKLLNYSASVMAIAALTLSACNKDDDQIIPIEDNTLIVSAQLDLVEVNGDAHGDHFHDLAEITGTKDSLTIEFDHTGKATKGGHVHLDPEKIYRIQLRAYNAAGEEIQNNFIASKTVADNFKAFIIGGDLTLNTDRPEEDGAIYQARETTYVDGVAVNGKYEMTGVLGYLTLGHANEDFNSAITYVMRKFNDAGTKAKVERNDFNRNDYATEFPGEDILKLTFEIHAESHDHHGDDHNH